MPGNLCEHCSGMCCRYLALPIDAPEDREEFDDIRWYLLHKGVSVFVEDGEWYLYMAADCRHLQPDFRCGIYETRPRICREYSTENCDYHSGDYGWEQHFTCPEHLDEYAQEYFSKQRKRRTRSSRANESRAGRKRPRVRARPGRGPRKRGRPGYADAKCDIAGTPLPVLRIER
jgi:Fe-S-cluster containining protein